jgi:exonuclease III
MTASSILSKHPKKKKKMTPVDVYRTFHPTSTQYTFFSAAHGTFSKIDHILEHKASLSIYKKI